MPYSGVGVPPAAAPPLSPCNWVAKMRSMRRIPAWTLTAIVLVCSATVPIIIRGAFRYHSVRKLLANFPYGEQRLSVSPKIKTLTTSTSIKPVNLGYATLDMGSTGQIYVATEGDRAVVVITNTDFEFRLSAPFAFGGPTNGVAMHIEAEETHILPISQITLSPRMTSTFMPSSWLARPGCIGVATRSGRSQHRT
jgi:hypothetical protein